MNKSLSRSRTDKDNPKTSMRPGTQPRGSSHEPVGSVTPSFVVRCPEGPPSMPRHTTKPKPPRPRRRASLLQTAERLAVAERTARQMIYDGRLKGYRLGRTVRVDLNEVDDALLPFGGN